MGKGARGNKAEPPPPFLYRLISVQLQSRDFIPDFTLLYETQWKNTPKNPLDQKPSFSRLTSVKFGAASISFLAIIFWRLLIIYLCPDLCTLHLNF